MQRVQSIQVLRGVAAAGVVLLHSVIAWEGAAHHPIGDWAHASGLGVDLFFVISGFIMASLASAGPEPAEFVWRRYLRVAPVYYALSLPWFLMHAYVRPEGLAEQTFATLAFWPVSGGEIVPTLLPAGWTLCFEAVFYLAVGLVIWGRGRAAVAVGALWLAAFALNLHGWTGWPQFLGSPMFLEFGVGVLIARSRPVPSERRGALALAVAALLLAGWLAVGIGKIHDAKYVWDVMIALKRVAVFAPIAGLTVWGSLALEPWFRGRIVRALAYLGDASYSTYLAHMLVVAFTAEVWHFVGWPVLLLPFVLFATSHAVGIEVHRLIELPLLSRLKKRKPLPVAAE